MTQSPPIRTIVLGRGGNASPYWSFTGAPIPEFDLYLINEFGAILNQKSQLIVRQYQRPDGYFTARLKCNDGKFKHVRTHRAVLMAHVSLPPFPKAEAAHNNGVRWSNHVSNLRWATRTENQHDRWKHGTHTRGERHGMSKLREHEVLEIRQLLSTRSKSLIAERFGVSKTAIFKIASGARWAWLQSDGGSHA